MPSKYFKDLSLKEQITFMKDIDTLIFDCDGVLWLGTMPIDGAVNLLNLFHQHGKQLFYVSNNSTKTIEQYFKKFYALGFPCNQDMVYATTTVIGNYVKSKMDNTKSVYVIGSDAVSKELTKNGIKNFRHDRDDVEHPEELSKTDIQQQIPLHNDIGAVVLAFDPYFNYTKMIRACSYLKNMDCLFISSSDDSTFPHPNPEYALPGTGALLAAIEFASGRKAKRLGKPNQFIADQIKSKYNIEPKRTLMVGDRCNTDILFGKRAGFWTMLVLTGVHKLEHIKQFDASKNEGDKKSVPTYYTDSVKDLIPALEAIFIK